MKEKDLMIDTFERMCNEARICETDFEKVVSPILKETFARLVEQSPEQAQLILQSFALILQSVV